MVTSTPPRWAVVYAAVSLVVGPAVYLLGYVLFTRGGGDYCDGSYDLPDGSPDPAARTTFSGYLDPVRITEFANAALFHVIGASVMLIVGATILAALARRHAQGSRTVSALAAALTVLMMLGHVGLIRLSGAGGQVC